MFCLSLNTSFLSFVNKHQEAEKATYPLGSSTWIGEGVLGTSEMETGPGLGRHRDSTRGWLKEQL